jgi:hypothetical protein
MRRLLFTMLVACIPLAAHAQHRSTRSVDSDLTDRIPTEIRRDVEARWNDSSAIRAYGPVTVGRDSVISASLAVQNGHLTVAGRVTGNITAINGDVTLLPGARVDGDLWVIGGRLDGRDSANVRGEIRVYSGTISVSRSGDRVLIDDEQPRRYRRRYMRMGDESWSDPIHLATAGAYNRVEGLPIEIGPALYQATPWGSARLDASAIVRTGSTFESDHGDVGHDIKAEVRAGRQSGLGIGGRLFNRIDAVEPWQLSDIEASLASFVFRRDYRDYFARRGVAGFARLYGGRVSSLTASFSDERWDSRDRLNPFTLFRGDATWRPNPAMDVGRMHVGNLTLKYDTRTDIDEPRSGVYVVIDAERGMGRLSTIAPSSTPRPYDPGDAIAYNRGFIDARSYSRLSPVGQVSFRVVAGGWMSGDQLPLERRLSVEGPSLLPGFDFRDVDGTFDTGSCTVGAPLGRPAECDRIAVAQVEYRGSLHMDFGDWREDNGRYIGAHSDGSWVMFADAGRGWMVGPASGDMTYPRGVLPPTSTFRSDLGVGFDFGGFGLYAAKAVSPSREPVNFFLRLHRRF